MRISKRSDLLPLPDNGSAPTPYQVFGLKEREADLQVIDNAIQSTITKLKAVRDEVEPSLWKQVAILVQNSRVVLLDPEKKHALDLQQSKQSKTAQKTPPTASRPTDPLASLLPPVNPIAPAKPDPLVTPAASVNPMAPPSKSKSQAPPPSAQPPSTPPIPDGLFRGPAVNEEGAPVIRGENALPTEEQTDPVAVIPSIRNTKPRLARRPRKSLLGKMVATTITLSLLVLSGGLIYYLALGSGTLSISRQDGGLTISTKQPPPQTSPVVSPPVEQKMKSRPIRDPVMGVIGSKTPKGATNPPTFPKNQASPPKSSDATKILDAPRDPSSEDTPAPPVKPMLQTKPAPAPEPAMPQKSDEVTPEMVAATETSISDLGKAIAQRRWPKLKEMSERLIDQPRSDEQTPMVEGLFQVVDLATYYRDGIKQGVAGLNTGKDFEVSDDVRVIIVAHSEESLTVRFNAKNRTYSIDELPLSLAHRLASFQIPAGPLREASKAVYQALAPKSTEEHRVESVKTIRSLPEGSVPGVAPEQLVLALESLFTN